MKTVGAAFLGDVLDVQVSISAEGLDRLIDESFGLVGIFLVHGNAGGGGAMGRLPRHLLRQGCG